MYSRPKECFVLMLILIYISTTNSQCRSGCKCSPTLTVCSFHTGINTMPNNLPSQMNALTIAGTYSTQNALGHLSASTFPFSKMIHLRLSYCGIDSLQDGTFTSLSELKSLSLEFNKIPALTQKTFQGLNHLIKLDLSGNENCNIAPGTFDNILSLRELSLAEMNLETFDVNLIKALKNLVMLDIHGSRLKTIDWTVFQSFPILKRLDLSGNQLTSIPSLMSVTIERLSSINLANNPWICNFQMKWLRDSKTILNLQSSWENIVCNSPDDLKFMSLINVPGPKLDPVLPKVVNCDTNVTRVNEGFPVVITCTIKGDPFPAVIWTNQRGTAFESTSGGKNGYHIFTNGTLYIERISASDNGNWTLQLTSKFGEDHRTVYINVILSTTTTTTTTTTTPTPTPTTTSTTATTTPTTTCPPTTITTPTTTSPKPKPTTTSSHISSTEFRTLDNSTKQPPDEPTNMLMYYAAGGGGGLLLILLIIIICCVICKKSGAVEDTESKFDSVKTPRKTPRPRRVNVAPHKHSYY